MGPQEAHCPKCREPALRERWGCDHDARMPVWKGTCEFCLGGGCEKCDGAGERMHFRCPASLGGWEGRRVIERTVAFDLGILPCVGGYEDQTYSGMQAISLARSEQGKIERSMMEAARSTAK